MRYAPTAMLASAMTACVTAAIPPALAQETAGRDDTHTRAHRQAERQGQSDIVVTAHPPVDFGILSSATSLQGDELVAKSRSQIGEMLAGLPGVSATSFAPGASRPVLRGFSGDRVAVLVDGIGSIDASTVSADHAVVLDSLTVDHIDIFHGPAVLIFGGNAIGGAVNALDNRIPRRVPDGIEGELRAGYGSAADERSAAATVQFRLAPRLAANVYGSWNKRDDLRIGGFANSPSLRAELLDEAAEHREEGEIEEAEEFEELAGLKGRLPNTRSRTSTFGAGLSFIDSGGNLGVAVQRYDTRYGVPLRPGTSHHNEEEDEHGEEDHGAEEHGHEEGELVTIDLRQTRVDWRGGINLGGWLDSLQVRGAFADYAHVELEGDEIGTRFEGKGIEFRADLVQSENNGWRGRSGMHYVHRKLLVDGAEGFTPDYSVERIGLFTLQSLDLGSGFRIEGAGRFEHVKVEAPGDGIARSYELLSGAAGLSFAPASGWKLGMNYTHGARAPSPEELLSDGLHVATQAYEMGNPDFGKETSDGFEAYVRYRGDRAELALTGYLTDFNGFITALPTGEEIEDFPVFRYQQHSARFTGFEASGRWEALRWTDGEAWIEAGADYTRATLKGIGPVPRIPPLRLRGGAGARFGALRIHGEVEWNDRQDRVAAFETPVPGFTIVNLGADWHPFGEDGPLTLLLAANNVFDAVGRRAASFTRDFVPLAGRDIRITGKLTF
jgi:iron complex outermembrane recepter protein